jgi:hypothetical protein
MNSLGFKRLTFVFEPPNLEAEHQEGLSGIFEQQKKAEKACFLVFRMPKVQFHPKVLETY